VPTGPFGAAELAGADVVIDSLHELAAALAGLAEG